VSPAVSTVTPNQTWIDTQVHQMRYEAEINEIYCRLRAAKLRRRDKAARLVATLVGAIATATTAGVVAESFEGVEYLAVFLTFCTTVLAGLTSIFPWGDEAAAYGQRAMSWSKVAGDALVLELGQDSGADMHAQLLVIVRAAEELQATHAEAPDEELVDQAVQTVATRFQQIRVGNIKLRDKIVAAERAEALALEEAPSGTT